MLHKWFGRAIALLGIAQVALGLTLYGSPLYLFILYALWVFALLVTYFILEWMHERRRGYYASEGGSYYSDEVVSARPDHEHGGWGKLAAAGAAGAGLAALWNRRKSKQETARPDVIRNPSSISSYISEEKYGHTPRRGTGWGTRLLEVGAVAGGLAAMKRVFGRKNRDDDSVVGPYRPPLGGNQSVATSDTMSRVEEGRPPMQPVTPVGASPGYVRPSHPLAQPPITPGRVSNDSYSYGSYMSGSPSRRDRRHHTFRDALAAGGAAFAVRSLFKNRKQKKEERRAEELRNQRIEEERVARMNSAGGYTGDGIAGPRRHDRIGSQSASDASSILEDGGIGLGAGTAAAAAAGALADRDRIRPVGADPMVNAPGVPVGGPADIPPAPPIHGGDLSSGSELYTTGSGRQRHRHHLRDEAAAGLAGAALGAAAADGARRRRSGQNTDSVESPPVSVKVKMHNDGRHVTLRRLTEEEAAAQRRRERRASGATRKRRTSSLSSGSGGEALGAGPSGDSRWRRTEAIEAQQAAQNAQTAPAIPPAARPMADLRTASISPQGPYPTPPPPGTQAIDPRTGQSYHMPVPPPIPGSTSNLGPAGSVTSPGTETSGATEYANNRRRRRAERAQARLAREGRSGNNVEFS